LEDLGDVDLQGIDWAILGGESGPGARSCDIQWLHNLKNQVKADGLALFVKQLGSKPYSYAGPLQLKDRKGGDMSEWPEGLDVRQMPEVKP
jgi:protein gp37